MFFLPGQVWSWNECFFHLNMSEAEMKVFYLNMSGLWCEMLIFSAIVSFRYDLEDCSIASPARTKSYFWFFFKFGGIRWPVLFVIGYPARVSFPQTPRLICLHSKLKLLLLVLRFLLTKKCTRTPILKPCLFYVPKT